MTAPGDPAARRVFLAATGQNRGKTTASLGLIAGIMRTGHRLGFLKPVGQRYLVVDGTRADEDAVLVREVFDLPDALNDMSPVTLPRHFTTDFIMGRITDDLAGQVEQIAHALGVDVAPHGIADFGQGDLQFLQALFDAHGSPPAAPVAMKPSIEETPAEEEFTRIYAIYWGIVLLLLLAIVILAGIDFFAIRRFGLRHYRQIQADRRAMIEGELSRIRSQRNGHRG